MSNQKNPLNPKFNAELDDLLAGKATKWEDSHIDKDPNYTDHLFDDDPQKATPESTNPEKIQSAIEQGHPRELSTKTRQTYQAHLKAIIRKLIDSNPMEFERRPFLPTELVNHLLSITHEIRPKTFLAYRSALLYWLNTQPPSTEKHNAILALNAEIPRYGFKGVAPDKPATLYSNKSQRKRTFRQKDFQKLMTELNSRVQSKLHRTAQIAQNLMLWLQAGLATGLRPIEWEHAVWEDEENGVLRVQTAKRKTGSNSLPALEDLPPQAERTRIINVDKDKIFWVSQHMIRVKNHLLQGLSFRLYYNNVRTYLWKVNKELFGNNTLNLYMLRGQFASNQKGSGMTVEEVARIMGCSPLVTQVNYGKKVNAHRSSQYPAPSAYKTSENSKNNPMKPT